MKNIDEAIKKTMEIKFTYVDLFYAFCKAKGIEDPECDVETDEEYSALEEEFINKIKFIDLWNLSAAILSNGLKLIDDAMKEVEGR